MASSVLFSPLPSTAFLHKHSTKSTTSPLLCNFSPFSISISTSTKPTTAFSIRVRPFSTSAPSVDVRVPDKSNGSDASTRKDHLDISKLGISDEIVSALSRRGITELFPIQRAVLEPAMEGRDMIGRAITGSGKTLAFGIPILDKIIRHHRHNRVVGKRVPSALILAPTRELARQVQKEFKESAPNLSSACLYGGIPIMNQKRMLGFGIDVVVGTPGRIIDLVERGALNLSEVKFVVLDEADQMLAIGFQENVECILSYLPTKKQFMLFSATMPSWVNELSRKYLKNPLVIDLVGDSDQKLANGISLYSIVSNASSKPSILHTLISRHGQGGKTIIFTKTKKDAEELSRSMVGILGSRALHGNMQQFTRDKTIAAFRDGQFNVLVATDVAARGLDIPNVDLVIHFEIPNTSEIFVHRSGRTGRAGKNGTAILIFTESQRRAVRLIERDLNCKFEELPRLTVGVGNKISSTDMEGRHNGTYDNSERRPLGYSDRFATNRFGNSVGNRGQKYGNINESRVRRSTSFKQSGGRFGGHERSRKNHYSENPGGRNTQFLKYRSPQLPDYDESDDYYEDAMASDSESSRRHSRSASKHRFDGGRSFSSEKGHSISEGSIDFKQIIEALRDRS